MEIWCKCLNFSASSQQLERSLGSVDGNGGGGGGKPHSNNNNNDISSSSNSKNNNSGAGKGSLAELLLRKFQEKHPKDFYFYNQFLDFFANAQGPFTDLCVNVLRHPELVYKLTLETAAGCQWQLCVCINCEQVLCAKQEKLSAGVHFPVQQLINGQMLISPETLALRLKHKSYSEAFEILIMDHDDTAPGNGATAAPAATTASHVPLDGRQQRVLQLRASRQARLQDEIDETNRRIERNTEQEFALLESFTEKCKQESALLERRVLQLPEQSCLLLDCAMPAALDVTCSAPLGHGSRRRNTISSRRELGVPTTPTTPLLQPPNFLALRQDVPQQQQQVPLQQQLLQQQQLQQQQQPLPSATILTTRKMSNFDTPPATPEATPMSVGNSPTFRQQQQQQQQQQHHQILVTNNLRLPLTPAIAADDADDCLFDLEDVDGSTQLPHFYPQQQQQYQRLQQQQQQLLLQQQQDNMSDADEAEDALDLDSSLPIPMRGAAGGVHGGAAAQMNYANFARSLPVDIANSPMAIRAINNNNNPHVHPEDDELLDNTVDIAASIKALAKSVHGEAVFGDLPRPRLPSQF